MATRDTNENNSATEAPSIAALQERIATLEKVADRLFKLALLEHAPERLLEVEKAEEIDRAKAAGGTMPRIFSWDRTAKQSTSI